MISFFQLMNIKSSTRTKFRMMTFLYTHSKECLVIFGISRWVKKTAHIGAGDYNKNHIVETDKFLKKHGGKIVKTVGRPIRLATPENCMPYSDGNIVGVGESIGTVFPLLGEGIIPSMECADILVDNVGNIAEYERQVAKHFAIYGTVYDFVRKKIDGKFNPVTQIANMLAIFRYMKRNEDRFGMDIKLRLLMYTRN